MKEIPTHLSQSAGYSGIYLERSGIESARLAQELANPPERPLADVDKAEVIEFESTMLDSVVSPGATLEDVVRMQISESSIAPFFFAKGLMSGDVQVEGVDLPQFSSPTDAYRWVATSGLSRDQLMDISKKSTESYRTSIAKKLTSEQDIDDESIDFRPIVVDPGNFARKVKELHRARNMLLDWKLQAPRGDDKSDAKVAYVDIFLSKLNASLAQAIPIVGYLGEQADLTGDDRLGLLAEGLVSANISRALVGDVAKKQRLFRRLDFLRNGIGYGDDGSSTGVSAKVKTEKEEAPLGGVFSPEQMKQMKHAMLTPEEMKVIFKRILNSAGLLSAEDESTYTPDRKGRAGDGLFQVVINPEKTTFAVDSVKGVYKVSSEPRSLYDVIIVGSFHELEHVNQALADEAVGRTVRIARIKGKRVSGLREAGANIRQRQAEEDLFGYRKPYVDTYASSLAALESGEGLGGAVKAFYYAKLRAMPGIDKSNAAKEAADRVLRLVRGGINSQPMVYAEESIMSQELSSASIAAQGRALAVTGLDLVDQARLHRFGLLNVPSDTTVDWPELIMKELGSYIDECLRRV